MGTPSDELTLQARCGLMAVHGRRFGAPRPLPFDYVTRTAVTAHLTGLFAAQLTRLRSGVPTTISTRADACALMTVSQYLAAATADDSEAVPLAPGTATFTSSDGVDFEIESLTTEPWARFWHTLGAATPAIARGWAPFQFRYATACAPLPSELADAATANEWERISRAAEENGVGLVRLDTPTPPASASGGLWTLNPLTAGDRERLSPTRQGLPLQGLTVLEAGRRIQAPLTAHLLRLLGASVVRVEPPGGDPLRGMPPMSGEISARWLALNHGKDAVQVDIKTSLGRAELRELVRESDVFLHNWAPGKAEELGLCAGSLSRVNPSLVHAYTSGWGEAADDLPPGTDFMVQAETGLTSPSVDGAGRTVASLMTVLDVLGGFLGAQAVTAALVHRQVSGGGVAVESSLLGASRLLSSARRADTQSLRRTEDGWDTDGSGLRLAVTERLPELEHEPALADLLTRTGQGCLTVRSPWEVA
ncbi:predicted acyl-CoA transferase/carnitine dehydratase [Nocardiopsis sp. JB363]|nr:predicted acyl-CoA transferase/carnitine dehydratase [Nocardiopsis sp. JB363]